MKGLELRRDIEKSVGDTNVARSASDPRKSASLLTWMAEKSSAVFVIATANAIDKLPPELLRKGRFDEIFFLDLPKSDERMSILDLHLKKRRPNYNFQLSTVVDRTNGYSGAELEQAVIEAMYFAFAEKRELVEGDLILASSQLVPLSRTAREQLESLREWASSGRARASSPKLF